MRDSNGWICVQLWKQQLFHAIDQRQKSVLRHMPHQTSWVWLSPSDLWIWKLHKYFIVIRRELEKPGGRSSVIKTESLRSCRNMSRDQMGHSTGSSNSHYRWEKKRAWCWMYFCRDRYEEQKREARLWMETKQYSPQSHGRSGAALWYFHRLGMLLYA